MTWYIEGNAANREDFIKNAYTSKAFDFWLNKGSSADVLFIDDARVGIYEHKVQINGKWKSFTCSGGNCYLCGMEKPRSYSENSTVLDFTPYTSKKDGKEYKYSRKRLSVGKDMAAVLELRRKECGGSLLGSKFHVSRTGEKSPACGNDWKFMTKIDFQKHPLPADVKPFDFREILKPRPPEEIMAIMNWAGRSNALADTVRRDELEAGSTAGPGDPNPPPMSDEEIPF